MAVRVVRLGEPRDRGEGLRIGTVRHPPRGVRKQDLARRDYYDAWLPELSPSAPLVSWALSEPWTDARWRRFAARYRREMSSPSARHLIATLGALAARRVLGRLLLQGRVAVPPRRAGRAPGGGRSEDGDPAMIAALHVGAAILVMIASAGPTPEPERSVIEEATREGRTAAVEAPGTLADAVVGLVESASVNSTAWAHPAERWARDLKAPTRVHVTFAPPREMKMMDAPNRGWRRRKVDEILLVLPAGAWPDHLLLRTEGTVVAVTKYAPCPLLSVVLIPVPPLTNERYDLLRESCRVPSSPRQ